MKKIGVLNRELSEVIARMGHNDMLVIGDAGLPIPACTQRIDLALSKNIPGFIDTVKTIGLELEVDQCTMYGDSSYRRLGSRSNAQRPSRCLFADQRRSRSCVHPAAQPPPALWTRR